MITTTKLSNIEGEFFDKPTFYRSVVGALQYVTLIRLEIVFVVNKVSQFMHQPQLPHWLGVKKILRYLVGTIDHGIIFRPCTNLRIFAFAGSNWGSDVDDRRSTSGSCVFLGSNIVAWYSRQQRSVSRSSAEAEFQSIAAVEIDI
ncbi:uncharacterized mitochondrial protein AtMg00810-like [Arachis hypogaea]|uniref:uncharacterized mitochondrial protein AtMg00810-like n=1 Tax=Arachis hypogaea TaxID=3818 RepID=UPI000DEC0A87|nr:uncharacterized protein LOC112783896 [Arachis hypogaea]